MLAFNREKVQANITQASTPDLLDRVTIYRAGMEAEAVEMIEEELIRRGVTPEQVREHSRHYGEVVRDAAGVPRRCWRCQKPAVATAWVTHKLFGLVPLFPVRRAFCAEHAPP